LTPAGSLPGATTSPSFKLNGVPKGTAYISLQMVDRQSSYNHGGGEVPYKGEGVIACGAIPSGWIGPFPPNGEVHTYVFILKALDANRNSLGTTSAARKFPE
jgi:phosphatidylethanolamine-binding protein (PEBP) family uncharacterized protein